MARICAATGAEAAEIKERLQGLWGGYGEILRVELHGVAVQTVIVKHVCPPTSPARDALISHRRKLRSFEVECHWYQHFAERCTLLSRVPAAISCDKLAAEWLFILEDLAAAGYPLQRARPSAGEVHACLTWLANLHAIFLGESSGLLWKVGTYWHLGTRMNELARMPDTALRRAAGAIDARLNAAAFKTVLHGDAKLDNFCFSEAEGQVAAVDFQYAGRGVGVKDVAYFLSSCLTASECESYAPWHLDSYFAALRTALAKLKPEVDAAAVEAEWRALYPFAWADLQRFLEGWAPGEYSNHSYATRLCREVLRELGS